VFNRPDEDIRREIVDQVLVRGFMFDPSRFRITVHDGVVVLEGPVGRLSLRPWVVRAAVEGVVRVKNRLAYDVDDLDVGPLLPYPWVGR